MLTSLLLKLRKTLILPSSTLGSHILTFHAISMQLNILTPIDTHGQPDQVFNSYLYNLVSLEKVVLPRLSMAAHATLVDNDAQYVSEMDAMLYHLATLATSLHQLSACLLSAHEELEIFMSEGADLEWFAHYKRDAAAQQKSSHRPAQSQSLAPFQLHAVLAPFFAGYLDGGERIGTSQATDFRYHSDLLRNELTFVLRDPTQPATPANLITRRPDELVGLPLEQPDERWAGYDVSLSGPEAAAQFETLLHQCRQAADLYHSLAADDGAGHQRLYELLHGILDDPAAT
jgi:hypothetical protein